MHTPQKSRLRTLCLGLLGTWLGLMHPAKSPASDAVGTPCPAPATVGEITKDLVVARVYSGCDPVRFPLGTEEGWEHAKTGLEQVQKTFAASAGKENGRAFALATIILQLAAAPKDDFEKLTREYETFMRAGKWAMRTPAEGMQILGSLYRARGYDKEAAAVYESEVRRCTAAKDQTGLSRADDGQGMLLAAKGDLDGAERSFRASLAIREKSNSWETAHSWLLLAGWHALRGDSPASDEDRRHASLTLSQGRWSSPLPKELLVGGDTRQRCMEAVGTLFDFAWQFQSRGDYASADRLMTVALAVTDEWFSRTDLWAIRLRKLAAISAFAAGRTEAAGALSREAEDRSVRALSPISWRLDYERAADFASYCNSISEEFVADQADAGAFAQGLLDRKGIAFNQALAKRRAVLAADGQSRPGQLAGELTRKRAAFRNQVLLDHYASHSPELEQLEASLADAIDLPDVARRPTVAQLTAALPPGAAYIDYTVGDQWTEKTSAVTGWSAAVIQPGQPPAVAHCGSAKTVHAQIAVYRKLASDAELARAQPAALEAASRALYQSLVAPVERLLGPGTTVVYVGLDGPLAFVGLQALLDGEGRFWCERRDVRFVAGGPALLTHAEAVPPAGDRLVGLVGDPAYASDAPKKGVVKKQTGQTGLEFLGADVRRLTPAMQAQMAAAFRHLPEAQKKQLAELNGGAPADAGSKVVLPALPGTRQEVSRLTDIFTAAGWQVQSWVGTEAGEESVAQIRRPEILHIATHGMFLDRLPGRAAPLESAFDRESAPGGSLLPRQDALASKGGLDKEKMSPLYRSYLALAGAETSLNMWREGLCPGPASDGVWMADEVLDLDLSRALLVTLSSCETGLGESVRGEGSVGMQRAFLVAGTRNVLGTLWPIADAETVEFMEAFYRRVTAGEKPSAALSSVQKDLLIQRRAKAGLGAAVNLTAPFVLTSVEW